MSDGMVNLIEGKVLNSLNEGGILSSKLDNKLKEIQKGIDTKGWRKVSLQGDNNRPILKKDKSSDLIAISKTPNKNIKSLKKQ